MKPFLFLPFLYFMQFSFAQSNKNTTKTTEQKAIPKIAISYRDLKIDTLSVDDYFIISGNGGSFLNENQDLLSKKTPGFFNSSIERLLNGKTSEIDGYLPERLQGEYTNAMNSMLYRIKSYLVYLGNEQISVYSKQGKFLYDFKTKLKIGEYSYFDLVFNEDFSQFAIIKDGDIFTSNFDVKNGKYSEPKQISFTGNFLTNAVREIKVWKGNIILYNSQRLDTKTGEVIPAIMYKPIASSEYISKEHEKNIFYVHNWEIKGEDDNKIVSGGIYKYDIIQNKYFNLYHLHFANNFVGKKDLDFIY